MSVEIASIDNNLRNFGLIDKYQVYGKKISLFLHRGSATLSGGSQAPYLIGGNDPHFFSYFLKKD
jgi:hypothetical protein